MISIRPSSIKRFLRVHRFTIHHLLLLRISKCLLIIPIDRCCWRSSRNNSDLSPWPIQIASSVFTPPTKKDNESNRKSKHDYPSNDDTNYGSDWKHCRNIIIIVVVASTEAWWAISCDIAAIQSAILDDAVHTHFFDYNIIIGESSSGDMILILSNFESKLEKT